MDRGLSLLISYTSSFQDQYCGQFGITNCPDQDELKVADQDQDGFLSPDELHYLGLHVTNPA